MRANRKTRKNDRVDLIPMIDVVFQLVIFFLVSATFAVIPAININLPKSSTSQGVEISKIRISVDNAGQLRMNDDVVSFNMIGKRLSKFDTNGKNPEDVPVILEADEEVTNGTIVKILDEIRKAGFATVDLKTLEK
ncbi:ExbD/TolR family protein [Treponema zioleckii]|uniref:ExbD/TolR family protein n=1 Tax=Treponema zioleckii TaxID=331680 RepID=UPI00168A9534|nr:biopolymer transporter ExbD [Treponema zioleckii]